MTNVVLLLTTINFPHPRFLEWLEEFSMAVVVGDKKTPHEEWEHLASTHDRITYLSPSRQESLFPQLSEALGWNSYARKNTGYAYIYSLGFKNIFETDDDTFPRSELNVVLSRVMKSEVQAKVPVSYVEQEAGLELWWNPYDYFASEADVWPRGLPLNQIRKDYDWSYDIESKVSPRHMQFLVNREPDLDAIFRLTRRQLDFEFNQSTTLIDSSRIPTPGNTQATLTRDLKEYLYFPSTCSLRVGDIIRSYWIQCEFGIVYGGFLVEQIRNPHNYLSDFQLELDLYLRADEIMALIRLNISGGMIQVLSSLVDAGVLLKEELSIFNTFKESLKN